MSNIINLKKLVQAIILFCSIFAMTQSATAAREVKNISEFNNGKTIELEQGQKLAVFVPGYVKSGKRWKIIELNSSMLTKINSYITPRTPTKRGGAKVIEFIAKKPGRSKLALALYNPDIEDNTQLRIFSVTVKITKLSSTRALSVSPSMMYLRDLQERFVKSRNGEILDKTSKLVWLEGPDHNMTWVKTKKWIDSLGSQWRLPTEDELKGIFDKKSKRTGKIESSSGFVPGPYSFKLARAFTRDHAYNVWSNEFDQNDADYFSFITGKAYLSYKNLSQVYALAVRNQ